MSRKQHWARQFELVIMFARSELLDQYRRSLLGGLWLFLQPLSYVLIFTVVFSVIMNARLSMFESPYAYSIYLVSGVLLWGMTANIIQRLSEVYHAKADMLKKINLSLSIMPMYIPVVELVVYLISMLFFVGFLVIIGHGFSWHWLFMPLIVVLMLMLAYGLGMVLGILSVFLPDIKSFVAILIQLLFWMTPIVYVSTILPEWVLEWMIFNPFFWGIDAAHQVILWKQVPNLWYLLALFTLGSLLLLLARRLQNLLEKDIRDLL